MSGVVLRAEQYDALHHVHIYVVPEQFDVPDDNKFLERQNVLAYPHIYTWFPGLTVELLPEGQGIPVTKGSRLALVVHFAPRTEPHEEVIRLGIHWANGKIERKRGVVRLVMPDINIPPNEPNYTYRKTATFEEDAWLTHFRAHMHLRGKSTQFTLHYPDGTSERVFDLPRYSFDWQRYYYLASPIHVPKDTELEIVATWDNSAGNPLNPNPSVPVRWGMNTADEMFGGSAHYVPVAKLANPVVVKNGIEADSQPPPK